MTAFVVIVVVPLLAGLLIFMLRDREGGRPSQSSGMDSSVFASTPSSVDGSSSHHASVDCSSSHGGDGGSCGH